MNHVDKNNMLVLGTIGWIVFPVVAVEGDSSRADCDDGQCPGAVQKGMLYMM